MAEQALTWSSDRISLLRCRICLWDQNLNRPCHRPLGVLWGCFLKNLFEGKEFKNTQVYCRMKFLIHPYMGLSHYSFLFWTPVDLNFPFVIQPWNSEDYCSLRFCNSFQNFCVLYFGFSSIKGIRDSATSWTAWWNSFLTRISGFNHGHELLYSWIHNK